MKYFVVSDIHSCYTKLKTALDNAGFNEETDTLVVAGDSFDRGDETIKTLNYLVDLPHKILLWGNHEHILHNLVYGREFWSIREVYNGTYKTVDAISGIYESSDMDIPLFMIKNKETAAAKQLDKYFNMLHNAVEFDKYYVTHGWLPYEGNRKFPNKPILDWKTLYTSGKYTKREADDIWERATWVSTPMCVKPYEAVDFFPDKTIIVGHYHADDLARFGYLDSRFDEYNKLGIPLIDMEVTDEWGQTFIDKVRERTDITYFSKDGKLIDLDGCTISKTGGVNVFVFEQENDPILY